MVASLLMLLAILLLEPLSTVSVSDLRTRVARAMLPRGMALGPGTMLITGGAIYLGLGALLGALYAVSQYRAPARALVAVGVFYGFVIWVGGKFVTAWLFRSIFG